MWYIFCSVKHRWGLSSCFSVPRVRVKLAVLGVLPRFIETFAIKGNEKMKKLSYLASALAFVFAVGVSTAGATVFTLIDENSSVEIDTSGQSGMYDWYVDGVSALQQQWFWYRDNTSGMTRELSLDNLTLDLAGVSDTDFDGDDDNLFVRYDNSTSTSAATFQVEINYRLAGGSAGSAASDVAETITINNLTNSALDFSFFQYSNFDLGDAGGDTAYMANPNTVTQYDSNVFLSETVVTPVATNWEIDHYSNTLNKLEDDLVTNLSNGTSPFTGDATWAFQWDVIIGGLGSFQISKDKNIRSVPEPATLFLLGTGLLGLAGYRKKEEN